MAKYSKFNIVYLMQKWMDSVAGQTFMNYAYSWGAAIVILGTLFKLTHLPYANIMLFVGMGTEVFVFFISAFDRPFDKTSDGMKLATDTEIANEEATEATFDAQEYQPGDDDITTETEETVETAEVPDDGEDGIEIVEEEETAQEGVVAQPQGTPIIIGGILGGGAPAAAVSGAPVSGVAASGVAVASATPAEAAAPQTVGDTANTLAAEGAQIAQNAAAQPAAAGEPIVVGAPAPAVSRETAMAMELATTTYVDRLNELNELLLKVGAQSERLTTDSEEMENLNRTLTGIARVYEMLLKNASQQMMTQDEINLQTQKLAKQISDLNSIYARMIEAMTINMPGAVAVPKS